MLMHLLRSSCVNTNLQLSVTIAAAVTAMAFLEKNFTFRDFQNLLRTIYIGLKLCIKHLALLACDFTDVPTLCITDL